MSMKFEDQGRVPRYALLTAAYNEEGLIAGTIESVASQTIRPIRWVIASDGSTDRTDQIVQDACARHSFMRFLRVDRALARGVARKVNALRLAHMELRDSEYAFVGNLDADVSFDNNYYETLLRRFQADHSLGITGGLICERSGKEYRSRLSNRVTSVAHAAQLVRRECYDAIGGYCPLKYGGEDWFAEVSARMRGWRVEASSELKILHHRPTGAADRVLRHRFREGKMDFSVGSDPVFEVLKCVRRIPEWPFAIGSLARLVGFAWSYVSRERRIVSSDFVNFLRAEQKHRLRLLLTFK
jgi:glycosyltransferase involved in cell wall biosynthesis